MSPKGHIWLDAKNNTIPLNSQLVGHIELIDPNTYWQSRATWTNIHSSVTPPKRGGAVNSTAGTQQPPQHTSPTSPIQNELEMLDNFLAWACQFNKVSQLCIFECQPKLEETFGNPRL